MPTTILGNPRIGVGTAVTVNRHPPQVKDFRLRA